MKRVPLLLTGLLCVYTAFCEGGFTTLSLDGKDYKGIHKVYFSADGRLILLHDGGGTSVDATKLPESFLKSWKITPDKIEEAKSSGKQKASDDLERAIKTGAFREVDGVVYDVRKPRSGWTRILNAKVVQVLSDGVIVNLTPDQLRVTAAFVENVPDTVSDTDYLNIIAKPNGTYSYINKLNDDRTIRAYDAGRVCRRGEIPDEVLRGEKPFASSLVHDGPNRDVLASLPERANLSASGTGFFITEDGYLITNYHVVEDGTTLKVKTKGGVFPATVIRTDKINDLALIKVGGKFSPIPISYRDVQLGEAVFTIGFPNITLQGTEPKYTDGKVSSLAGIRDDPSRYQISVPVQPGNSGGALIGSDGAVIGVVVARLNDMTTLKVSGSLPQNVNYAIKAKYIRDLLEQASINLRPVTAPKSNQSIESAQSAAAMVLVY